QTFGTGGLCFYTVAVQGDWSGLDWDMALNTDPDLSIMTAGPTNTDGSIHHTGTVGIELEHFSLPPNYRPIAAPETPGKFLDSDWVQATGRLIVDAGHDDWATELHPPELVV